MSTIEAKKSLSRKQRRQQKEGKTKLPATSLKLLSIRPITQAQKYAFDEFRNDQHLFLHGVAGTGKTFIALYLALEQVFSGFAEQNKVMIIRSAVASRDIGFLPGSVKDKVKEFEAPYQQIVGDLFERGDAYSILKEKRIAEFLSTSFVRGTTISDTIIILDEIQNFSFHEAHTVLTRVGKNCRVIVAGDFRQSDLIGRQKAGLDKLMRVAKNMPSFSFVEFGIEDIVRSGFVKEFLISCLKYEDQECSNMNFSPEPKYKTTIPNGADFTQHPLENFQA